MARIPFQKPKHIEWEINSDRYARLVAEPFEKGYALTVGNSLRRTLLSIIPGAAVSWVRIAGVKDAEAKIPGVREETVEVLLNLRKLALNVPSGEPLTTRLEATGPKDVTGADVSEGIGLEVLNPELPIATLEAGATLSIELGVGIGRGYVNAAGHPGGSVPAGAIAMDAAFSPIQRVSYNVEASRLGKIIDYERLILEVWTNGAVSPEEALTRAAGYMRDHFALPRPSRRPRGGRGSRGGRRGLPPGEPVQGARGAAAARARHQRAPERRDPHRGRPRPEDGRRARERQEPGLQVDRRDQGRPRRARAVAGDAHRPQRARGARAGRREMRHGRANYKLGRLTPHRWAMFRNLLVALFRHERIMTTEAKAKAVRGLADQMVTLAKRESLHAKRQVLAMVPDETVTKKLFDTIAPRFSDRNGGYTRIIHAGTRPGDRAPMVVLELVDRPEAPREKTKKDAKAEKAPKGEKADKGDKGEAAAGARKGRRKKAAAAAG